MRIRGNAHQVYEKYLTLARDATTSGDRVLAESLYQHADHYFRIYSAFNEENEARRNAQQQENASQPDAQPRVEDEAESGAAGETGDAERSEEDRGPVRKTRSERRQDAEAAEQAEQTRAPRQPRRRRSNGAGAPEGDDAPRADNDSALRAMLGASEAGLPKAASEDAPAEAAEADEKPVRRRGRPRKVAEPVEESLPLAGED